MSYHVGFYMILVYDVGIMMWPGQISSDLFKLNDQSLDWSGRCPLSVGHVPHGGMICCPRDHVILSIAIYAIVLFY